MAHVLDVERSLAFYALLGFSAQSTMKDHIGRTNWAMAASGGAEIMFAQADGEIDAEQQAVLFYMYCEDVAELRRRLLAAGVRDGGAYCGQPAPEGGPRMVFEIARPFYMPEGEVRVHDPDGYTILVGQLG